MSARHMDDPRQQFLDGIDSPEMRRLRSLAAPCVWTERMLETLERGIKGGKWYSLMDKVCRQGNLESALKQVCRNKGSAGIDGQSTEAVWQRRADPRGSRPGEAGIVPAGAHGRQPKP